MHHTIPYICIRYNQSLYNSQIPCFRAAMIEYVGRENHFFHNHHDQQKEAVESIKYPLIQYKVLFKNASLIALGRAATQMHNAVQPEMTLKIGDRNRNFMIDEFTFQHIKPGVTKKPRQYSMKTWMPFNQENFEVFKTIDDDFQKKNFMEQILENNIVAFFSGLDIHLERRIRAHIEKIKKEKVLRFKGVLMHTFDLNFTANADMPDFIGLGKGTAFGHGSIMRFNTGKN